MFVNNTHLCVPDPKFCCKLSMACSYDVTLLCVGFTEDTGDMQEMCEEAAGPGSRSHWN